MAEIPKIAQRRLQNEQLGAEVAHPDADLLTAFAEQALPARERDQVLAHLARCADCREIAALAGAAVAEPELVAAPKQVDHKPSRSFWSLRPLRWTAAAATAAVVLSAVWLNRKEVTRQELPAGTETNPAIVQQQNEPTPVPGVPATDKETAPQSPALRADMAPKFDALAKSKAASPKERDELAGAAVNEVAVDKFPAEKKQSPTGNVTDQKDAPMLRARETGQLQAAKVPSNQAVGGPLLAASAGAAAKAERALPSAQSGFEQRRGPRAGEECTTSSSTNHHDVQSTNRRGAGASRSGRRIANQWERVRHAAGFSIAGTSGPDGDSACQTMRRRSRTCKSLWI